MITIVSGTNRKNSVSLHIANQYKGILSELGEESNIVSLEELPEDYLNVALYENIGKNHQFNLLREQMNNAKKLVFIIPEYNGSFPGVLKAFIDGLDRGKALTNKKAALVGISDGDQGAGIALSHITDILNYCGTHVHGYRLRIPGIGNLMTDKVITNPIYIAKMHKQAANFIEF
ncbi:MAG: NAD(P)H-dependent oxidoreductase [Cyclobacteriaceae bacterium]|nr:NAD(P)H-dependent oxidoreductase [Cyclobacteriaceae bacterium]